MSQARDEAGNIWEVDAQGNAVRLIQAAPSSMAAPGQSGYVPPDPAQVRKAQADLTGRDLSNQKSAFDLYQDQATADAQRRKAAADAAKAEMDLRAAQQKAADDAQAAQAKLAARQAGQYDADTLLRNIRDAKSAISGWSTSWGSSLSGLRGSQAQHLSNLLQTIRSNVAFDRLQQMRDQSKTGGAVGNVSDNDLKLLAATGGSLDQKQAGPDLLRTLSDIENRYVGIRADLAGQPRDQAYKAYDSRFYPNGGLIPAVGGGTQPPAAGGGNASGSGQPGGGGLSPSGLATGATKDNYDAGASAVIDRGIRSGWTDAQINQALKPYNFGPVDPRQTKAARDYYRNHPDFSGSFGHAVHTTPTTAWNRFAASPTGTGIYAAADAALGGTTDEIASAFGGGNLADLNARKQLAFATNPKAAFVGQALGTAGSMAGLGALSRGVGLTGKFATPLVGDVLFGAASGAGQSNDNRLTGAALGGLGGLAGNVSGNVASKALGAAARTQPGLAVINRARGMFGGSLLSDVRPLTGADRTALNAIDRAGVGNITNSLTEAQQLGVPMSLADTDPNLRELAGAAVRRSPTASSFAEDALMPRARGQYDRFTSSVNSNLGPTANIPQLSADLTAQGRAAASDLYNRAYTNPVPSTPQIDAVLSTPFGRQALGRAHTIAANEMRAPDELGFALDADGNVVLNPRPSDAIARHLGARAELDDAQEAYRAARQQPSGNVDAARNRVLAAREGLRQAERGLSAAPDPSMPASVPAYTTQTLDYVKRGMDDVLEGQRNPITGKLVLDEAGRAQNGVRSQLLGEVDRLNPDFAAARAAYAGPVASRDALARGGDAYGLQPNELAMQVSNQTPEHLGQMQLGYRGAMVDHAGRIRDSGNPWDATLGSPVARQRLQTMYPDTPGVDRMIRQQELEKQLAQTTNAILGNSRTARNVIADQQFANPVMEGALHAGAAVATHGASVPGTAARLAGAGLKGRLALGLGKRAEAKADALAPILLNTDPVAALQTMSDYLEQQRARQALIQATTPKRLGMFGAALGSQAALVPAN